MSYIRRYTINEANLPVENEPMSFDRIGKSEAWELFTAQVKLLIEEDGMVLNGVTKMGPKSIWEFSVLTEAVRIPHQYIEIEI